MGRLRSINEAYKHLKDQDPGTSITPYFLRRMVYDGVIPCIMAGRKHLIDIDDLEAHLKAGLTLVLEPETPAMTGIRPISERKYNLI